MAVVVELPEAEPEVFTPAPACADVVEVPDADPEDAADAAAEAEAVDEPAAIAVVLTVESLPKKSSSSTSFAGEPSTHIIAPPLGYVIRLYMDDLTASTDSTC